MESCVNLHSQLASIMEVLANAAVAEICQLVDDGFASLRLEISRNQRENLALKSRLRLMEVRVGERPHREPVPSLVVTCTRRDHHFEEDGAKRKVKSADSQQSQPLGVTEHPSGATEYLLGATVQPPGATEHPSGATEYPPGATEQLMKPDVAVIKKERLEEELAGCSVLEDHLTCANSSIGSQRVGAEIPGESVSARSARPEAQQLEEEEGARDTRALGQYSHPAEQSHRAAPGGPNSGSTKEEHKHVVEPRDSVSAELSDVELPLTNTGVEVFCGAAADWRGEAASTLVKLEAEASWSEASRTHSAAVCVPRTVCVNDSRFHSHQAESDAAELDTNSLDSSSFDDLFSSPEVARSLTAPRKPPTDGGTGPEESLSSSSFPFLSSGSSSSVSDCLTGSSLSNVSSDSRSRSFPCSTERGFSCQQCGRLFSTSRDLVVHQRAHAGERIYHCHLCKKPFVHPHQLKTHQRVHTGEKPFSCAQCGKRFSQSSHIKRHMSVHTGEKRYSCSLCGKRFSQACSLKVHQAVHTGERPYSCTRCGKSFSVLGNLVRHQSVHISK